MVSGPAARVKLKRTFTPTVPLLPRRRANQRPEARVCCHALLPCCLISGLCSQASRVCCCVF